MPELYPDIWRHIASFIPRNDLGRLAGVNRTFFELAMANWKCVKFSTGAIQLRFLERLCDPFLGKWIRSLTLILYRNHGPPRKKVGNIQRRISSLVSSFRLFRGANSQARRQRDPEPELFADFEEVLESIAAAAPQFVEIRELSIRCTWNLEPSLTHRSMRPLVSAFSSAAGIRLCCLTLEASLEELKVMLEQRPILYSLEELNLVFKEESHTGNANSGNQSILVDIIAPFIHSLGAHLKTLSIMSFCKREHQELEDFFLAMAPMNSLIRLDIRSAFIRPSRYPRSLTTLFTENLQHLSLPVIPFKLHLEPAVQETLRDWLLLCISNENLFTGLRSLEIYSTKTMESIDITLAYIHRTAPHLSQLTIRSQPLQPNKFSILAHALGHCHHLTDLSFNIHRLGVVVFDQLSRELPYLYRLCISVKERLDLADNSESTDLKNRYYADWNIKDIWIKNSDQNVRRDVMLIIVRSLPSARYLFGVPVSA
ncbi:hypothetical protein JR316_0005776 [Psilocybe cubensis]|uniref:Uncharacterized protein n=2 Tax=Psilocybe cubensis TaxID=181762 RepID=A0ACB8H090_PSICU|nr:hypothetical protein JR316_0005776 [Psilocybe cubensis]KAH9481254.1 hypothetical protein JR316_0005776 [Psilocybe cubensis]